MLLAMRANQPQHPAPGPLGLGLDGGGTATRWALAAADGTVLARGEVGGISGLMLADASGQAALQATVAALSAQVLAAVPGRSGARPDRILAGLSGYASADEAALQALLGAPFALPPGAVRLMSDIELACRAALAPGEGLLVYAGTGSIAAHLDAQGQLWRAGGRGQWIDDAGGGVWIAAQALRSLWRLEDAEPGSAANTALGQQVFTHIGGSDWAHTRAWVYGGAGRPGASRGALGQLALAVAAAARQGDATALALLQEAGRELAALAQRLQRRLLQGHPQGLAAGPAGALPMALAGRVWQLHPAVQQAFVQALPAGSLICPAPACAEVAAAGLAATQSAP